MIVEAKRPFKFEISKTHIDAACKSCYLGEADPAQCVVAQGLRSAFKNMDKDVVDVQVGPQRTVVTLRGGKIVRYATPDDLKKALITFDDTHRWDLPAGQYTLNPLPKSATMQYARQRSVARRAAGDPNMKKGPQSAASSGKRRRGTRITARAIQIRNIKKENA